MFLMPKAILDQFRSINQGMVWGSIQGSMEITMKWEL